MADSSFTFWTVTEFFFSWIFLISGRLNLRMWNLRMWRISCLLLHSLPLCLILCLLLILIKSFMALDLIFTDMLVSCYCFGASLVAQMVKNPSAMQGSWVRSLVRKISWRREWLPSPILLPEEFQGQRSLVAYTPLGCKELDMTEWLTHTCVLLS